MVKNEKGIEGGSCKVVVWLELDYSKSDEFYITDTGGFLTKNDITDEVNRRYDIWYYYDIWPDDRGCDEDSEI